VKSAQVQTQKGQEPALALLVPTRQERVPPGLQELPSWSAHSLETKQSAASSHRSSVPAPAQPEVSSSCIRQELELRKELRSLRKPKV
jgi:hypothetical protein